MDQIENINDLIQKIGVLDATNIETLHAARLDRDFSLLEKLLNLLLALSALEDLNGARLALIVQYKHILRDLGLPF